MLLFILLFVSHMVQQPQIRFHENPVVAHRGAWKKNNLPENSIASLREAIRLKCTGTEFDIRMTADEVLIVNHDPDYHEMPIEKTNYSQLASVRLSNGEPLPTLENYLLEGMKDNPGTRLVLEIKPSPAGVDRGRQIAKQVVDLVHKLNAGAWATYISFDLEVLRSVRSLDPQAATQYLNGELSPGQLKQDGISGLDYHFNVFKKNPGWIVEAKKNKQALNAWTVNTNEDLVWFTTRSFDFITTNEPELLFDILKSRP